MAKTFRDLLEELPPDEPRKPRPEVSADGNRIKFDNITLEELKALEDEFQRHVNNGGKEES